MGDKVDSDLHVRDIVESNIEETGGLQVKYPICFGCFDNFHRLSVSVFIILEFLPGKSEGGLGPAPDPCC